MPPPIPQGPQQNVDGDPQGCDVDLASWVASVLARHKPQDAALLLRRLARKLDALAREIEDDHAPA